MTPFGTKRWLTLAWAGLAALFAVRLVHLRADFPLPPAFRLVRDGVLYTDEGWYAGNALMLFRTGEWYIPGDMNFAAVLPVQQLFYLPLFAALGPTIEAVRLGAVGAFAACVVLAALIVRRLAGEWPAVLAAALMTVNFMLFAYSRLGLSENLMMALQLGAVLAAMGAGAAGWRGIAATVAAAGLCLAALLTKTSALPSVPVVVLVAALSARGRWAVHGGLASALIVGGFVLHRLVTRAVFPDDVRFFHSINIGMQLDLDPYRAIVRGIKVVDETVERLDSILSYWVPLAVVVLAVVQRAPRLWVPIGLLCLYAGGYFAMLSVYDNLQPRYGVPLGAVGAMGCALLAGALWGERQSKPWIRWVLAVGAMAALAGTGRQFLKTAEYLRAPGYTLAEFAADVRKQMEAELPGERVLLGHSAHQLALFEPFVPVNDLYGSAPLEDRLDRFTPRFLITHGPVEPLRFQRLNHLERNPADYTRRYDVLAERYVITPLGTYDVLANYRRLPFHLYRLDPRSQP